MAKEIYSLDEDKMIDVEEAPKGEQLKDEESDEQEEQEEEEPGEDDKKTEEESEEGEDELESEGSEESEQEEEETESKAKKQSEEEDDNAPTVDEVIKNVFSEQYGITSEKDFVEVLDEATKILDENEQLKAEIKTLKEAPNKKEPEFKSEGQKAVYEMLKDYDPERIPDGLATMATLVAMDVNKTDNKLLLEQKFVMEHPELSIDRARRKFQRDFDAKYNIKEDDFDDLNDFKEKQKDIEEDLEIEAAQAKKYLKEKQKEIKIKSSEKEEKVGEEAKVPQQIQDSIARNTAEFNDHFQGIHTLSFQVNDNDDKNLFNYKFSKEQLEQIKKVANDHLKHPGAYDAKGNLVGGFDPEEKFQKIAFLVAGQEITQQALKFAEKYAQVIKAEQIAKKAPERKAKASGNAQSMSIDAQAERLAKKKQAEREGRRS